jgi:hypothetical protein
VTSLETIHPSAELQKFTLIYSTHCTLPLIPPHSASFDSHYKDYCAGEIEISTMNNIFAHVLCNMSKSKSSLNTNSPPASSIYLRLKTCRPPQLKYILYTVRPLAQLLATGGAHTAPKSSWISDRSPTVVCVCGKTKMETSTDSKLS